MQALLKKCLLNIVRDGILKNVHKESMADNKFSVAKNESLKRKKKK